MFPSSTATSLPAIQLSRTGATPLRLAPPGCPCICWHLRWLLLWNDPRCTHLGCTPRFKVSPSGCNRVGIKDQYTGPPVRGRGSPNAPIQRHLRVIFSDNALPNVGLYLFPEVVQYALASGQL